MPERFLGVYMARDYNWAYTCELCGKKVELQSKIIYRWGTTVSTSVLSGTFSSLDEEDKRAYRAQARTEFPAICENFVSKWKNGSYPDYVATKNGRCPHCLKNQHWSKVIAELSSEKPKTSAGDFVSGIFGGIFIAGILALIVRLITGSGIVFWIIFGTLSIASVPLVIWGAKQTLSQLLKEKAELETKEKQFPTFVSWGNTRED
jgi:hypothetical protein